MRLMRGGCMQFAPALGHLSKTATVRLLGVSNEARAELVEEADEVLEAEDDGAAVAAGATVDDAWATAALSICYSPTYQVPVLYFNIFLQCQSFCACPTCCLQA